MRRAFGAGRTGRAKRARRALVILLACAACAAVSAQAQTAPRYSFADLSAVYAGLPGAAGIASPNGLFPVGWSPDGKFAYVTESASSFRPDMVCRLVIQDMVTDRIVWDSGARSMMDLEESGKKLPALNGDILSAGYFFSYYYDEFAAQLSKYGIVGAPKADLFQFPCAVNGYTLDAQVAVRAKSTDPDFGDARVYSTYDYDLFMVHSALGRKKIFSEKLTQAYLFSAGPVGFFVSPFEKRAAVVVARYRWGLEMEYSADYTVVGSLYESGFTK